MAKFKKLQTQYINGEPLFNFGGLIPPVLFPDLLPSPTPTPSNTPTPTPSSTPVPTPTPTPSATPTYYYYNVFVCGDPFGPSYVVRSSSTLLPGEAVKVVGDDITCFEIIDAGLPPHNYIVQTRFTDCGTCQL